MLKVGMLHFDALGWKVGELQSWKVRLGYWKVSKFVSYHKALPCDNHVSLVEYICLISQLFPIVDGRYKRYGCGRGVY